MCKEVLLIFNNDNCCILEVTPFRGHLFSPYNAYLKSIFSLIPHIPHSAPPSRHYLNFILSLFHFFMIFISTSSFLQSFSIYSSDFLRCFFDMCSICVRYLFDSWDRTNIVKISRKYRSNVERRVGEGRKKPEIIVNFGESCVAVILFLGFPFFSFSPHIYYMYRVGWL